jgi:iron uptake system component EfeO
LIAHHRFPALLVLGTAALLGAVGCGSSDDAPKGAKTFSVQLTDEGCDPHTARIPAGPVTFEVENAGTSKVSEFEVLEGDTILGEKENLSDGFSGSFSLTLEEGTYTMYCPGGAVERGELTVTGGASAAPDPQLRGAVDDYRAYIERNADDLVVKTKPFVAAVVAGEVARAMSLYPAARIPYERIEPVAESFGDLDPEIDAREGDVPAGEWGGFHKIEQALWVDDTTDGMAAVARKLLVDVKRLQTKVRTVTLQAAQIANGANELLGEVSASKITGEEERYSHTDLVDFEANVDGSKAAYESVRPILEEKDPALAKEIDQRFAEAYRVLGPYGHLTEFVPYDELTKADTRKLARSIDALAEPLSQIPAQIVQ